MSSDLANNTFSCHSCGHQHYRVIVRGKTTRQQSGGHGEISMEDYTCTNREHGQFFQVVECRQCNLRALFPIPPAESIQQAYTQVRDSEYLTIEPSRRIAFTKLLNVLRSYTKPPGKLLDVGCYTGIFPQLAHDEGWDAFGIEPSVWASQVAGKRLPGKIQQGYLSTTTLPMESFDVVTSWDVIEHVTNPRGEIEAMSRLLKPGGWLFLSTMKSDAPVVKLLGSRWPWYMPMHLYYFTPKTLKDLVNETSLIPHGILPYPHYTPVKYALWKLESYLGPIAVLLRRLAEFSGLSGKVIKIDLGDFFLLAAQKKRNP